MLQNSYIVIGDPFTCLIQDPITKKMIGSAKCNKGLYMLECAPSFPLNKSVSVCAVSILDSFSNYVSNTIHTQFNPKEVSNLLWHYRLGHLSEGRLQFLNQIHNEIKSDHSEHCIICPLSKQHKLPFPIHVAATQHIFQSIHVDIWGPSNTITVHGHRYFLTMGFPSS